jgi:hypothetical protein
MFNLPQPMLGDITAITITTPSLDDSLAYYQKLGFAEVLRHDFPFPWIQITDGALLIMLRQYEKPYCGLTYYVKALDQVVEKLEQAGIVFIDKPAATDMIKRYMFQ